MGGWVGPMRTDADRGGWVGQGHADVRKARENRQKIGRKSGDFRRFADNSGPLSAISLLATNLLVLAT